MTARHLLAGALAAGAVLLGTAQPAAAADPRTQPGVLVIQTTPALAGVRFSADGSTVTTDEKGVARLPVRRFTGLEDRLTVPRTQIDATTIAELDLIAGNPANRVDGRPLHVGLKLSRLVRWSFVDLQQRPLPFERIDSMRLRNNIGEVITLEGDQLAVPRWMQATRTVRTHVGVLSKDLHYVVDGVDVDGAQVVNRAQQRFTPTESQAWAIELMFYQVKIKATDLVLGRPAGRTLQIRGPDGTISRHQLSSGGSIELPNLPRGQYELTVLGTPINITRPAMISRDQEIELRVLTAADFAVVLGTGGLAAITLLLIGQPRLRSLAFRPVRRRSRRPPPPAPPSPGSDEPAAREPARPASGRKSLWRVATGLSVLGLAAGGLAAGPGAARAAPATAAYQNPTVVLAYYYIWFNPTSWNRAKSDYPLAGRYSSDERDVMRNHVRQAKAVGIDGFLVSWKDREDLNRRLERLIEVAESENFQLGIVYQGLDFQREPLPIDTVDHDLNRFAKTFANSTVFDIFDKPVIVWTGTWKFSEEAIARVTGPLRRDLHILASARSPEDYLRVASAVDGNAYYWSSANADEHFAKKLAAMSTTVHSRGGLWIAPAAPGFDARLVGGTRIIPREDGATFRRQLAAAQASSPDAIGIISWNEFSENSHIEPSEKYGHTALEVLADVLGTRVVVLDDPDSSAGQPGGPTGAQTLGIFGGVLLVGALGYLVAMRQRHDTAYKGRDS